MLMIQQPDSLFSDGVTARDGLPPQSLAEEVEWRGGEGHWKIAFGGGRLQIHHFVKEVLHMLYFCAYVCFLEDKPIVDESWSDFRWGSKFSENVDEMEMESQMAVLVF